MRILITGGAGFIGSNFISYIQEKTKGVSHILVVDKLTPSASFNNLKYWNRTNLEFIEGDICDSQLIRRLVSDVECVIHFAAESHVDTSIINPKLFVETNVLGTQVLLDAIVNFSKSKLIYVSTDEIYGSLITGSFSEDDNYNPSSPYSATKAGGELLVKAYGTTYNLNYCITRCANNYGPRQNKEKLIPKLIHLINNKDLLPIYGDGKNIRDWIYVEDHCEAIFQIMMRGKNKEIYNIPGNSEKSNLEIASALLKEFNLTKNHINFVKDRPGHDFRYSISGSKIFNQLGFSAKTDFQSGIRKTISWYLSNPDF